MLFHQTNLKEKYQDNPLHLHPVHLQSVPLPKFEDGYPQKKIFQEFCEIITVGINPQASIAVINPKFSNMDFGIFTVPTLDALRTQAHWAYPDIHSSWSLTTHGHEQPRFVLVPPETGRAILLPQADHPLYRDIQVKGTGLVQRFTDNNKLRYGARGFNGFLELSEAERDLVNSEILHLAGMLVTAGIGVVNHQQVAQYEDFTAWTGNYIRGFQVQTRLSNLFELNPQIRKAAIDDAIERIQWVNRSWTSMSYVDYFRYILEKCAKNVAIMQAIGFTQDSFHYGQVTLCGELTDLGIGSFDKPTGPGVVNTIHPWFRYERQPILMQNILYKTHAVKAEPIPVRLSKDSRSVCEQQTLFGAIRSFAPFEASEIEALQPEKLFWDIYERTYRSFDVNRFEDQVLSRLGEYFEWKPHGILTQIPNQFSSAIERRYDESLDQLLSHFENQVGPWPRKGPTSVHKQILFGAAAKQVNPDLKLDFSNEKTGVWKFESENYLSETDALLNPNQDISWKPTLTTS